MAIAVLIVAAIAPVDAVAAEAALPNLVPLPPQKLFVGRADPFYEYTNNKAIRFATTLFNDGGAPLDLLAVPDSPGDLPTNGRSMSQCVRFVGPICVERRTIARAAYEPDDLSGQNRWIMRGVLARYALLPVTADGLPDFAAPPLQTSTGGFLCLHDFDQRPDITIADAPFYRVCGDGNRQGLTSGFGISRLKERPGQQVLLKDLPSGMYAIVVELNPDNIILESSYEDNRSWIVIQVALGSACHDTSFTILREGVS